MYKFRINRFSYTFAALVAASSVPLLSSSLALAATTAAVPLSGTVAETLSVTAAVDPGASSLDLDGEGSAAEHIFKVADISMDTNNEAGLTLTATSGALTKTGGTAIDYKVTSVIDTATAPISGAFTVPSGTSYTFETNAAGTSDEDLYISYTPEANQDPGVYTGSISLTVSDN